MNICHHLLIYRYHTWCSFLVYGAFFLVLILLPFESKGQNDIWIMNGFGIDFNTEPPSIISPLKAVHEIVNISSITDAQGNLLFYSDGMFVYNREHKIMPNGSYIRGGLGSYGSAYIVPVPNSQELYYLFSIEDIFVNREGMLRYSIVNMSKENGLGDVVEDKKNVLLLSGLTEYIAGAKGTLGTSWIITHARDTNLFYSIPITVEGIGTPIVSANEPSFIIGNPRNVYPTYLGSGIAFSPDYTKLAVSYTNVHEIEENEKLNFSVFLYDFDRCTGQISNAVQLSSEPSFRAANPCFSPDNTKLYVNEIKTVRIGAEFKYDNRIYQYNLSQNDLDSSKVLIAEPEGRITGSDIQIGPNNQILVGRRDRAYMDLLRAPNNKGPSCDYVINGLTLEGNIHDNMRFQNLLIRYDSILFNTPSFPTDTTLCSGDTLTIDLQAYKDPIWGDGSKASMRQIIKPGNYTLNAKTAEGCFVSDSVRVDFIQATTALGDTVVCTGDEVVLVLPSGGVGEWSDGIVSDHYVITQSGDYTVAYTESGCIIKDTVQVIIGQALENFLGEDTTLCPNDAIMLRVPQNIIDYEWSTGANNISIEVSAPGRYMLNVVDSIGCTSNDEIEILEGEQCECNIYVPSAMSPNSMMGNDIFRGVSNCDLSEYELSIYDRWGSQIYKSSSPMEGWNGYVSDQPVNTGVYSYILRYRYEKAERIEYITGMVMVYY